jgi:hypothetical protein
MSTQITIDLPDDAFSALRSRPEDFVKEMRLAAAVKWLEIGLVSQRRLRPQPKVYETFLVLMYAWV